MEEDGDEIKLKIHQTAPSELDKEIFSCKWTLLFTVNRILKKNLSLKFGPCPDTNEDYNFKEEFTQLPFPFNLEEPKLNKEQSDWLLNLVYDHKKILSLHDEKLGFCDKLSHCCIPLGYALALSWAL